MRQAQPPTCALGIMGSGPYGLSSPGAQPFSGCHSATNMVCGMNSWL